MVCKLRYKQMCYHGSYKGGEPFKVTGYFDTHDVLISKLMYWNGCSLEWKYWETVEDEVYNMTVEFEPLPIFNVGWYGRTEDAGYFNGEDGYINGSYL